MNIDTLISYYKRGAYSCRELAFQASRLISPDNVDEILSSVPEECLQELRNWAFSPPMNHRVLFAGDSSPQEVERIEGQLKTALPLIRDWFSNKNLFVMHEDTRLREQRSSPQSAPPAAARPGTAQRVARYLTTRSSGRRR